MRAAVIVPPVEDFYFTPHRFSILGAKVVCKILVDMGIPATLFNFPCLAEGASHIPLPPELYYLKDYIIGNEQGRLSFFKSYQRLGPGLDECARQVCAYAPDICLISCFAFCYADQALGLTSALKKMQPGLMIVAGGAGVSVNPHYFIRDPSIDFVLTGEAEVCLPAFMTWLQKRGHADSDMLKIPTPPLDLLPSTKNRCGWRYAEDPKPLYEAGEWRCDHTTAYGIHNI